MAPHSSTLAWKILWTKEPGRLQSMGSLRVGYDWATSLSCIGEGHGNPLQCSCLENPRGREVWWATVYGVAQSRTRVKRLSSSSSNGSLEDPTYHVSWANSQLTHCESYFPWREICWKQLQGRIWGGIFLIEIHLIYNIVLVSGIQQIDQLRIHTYIGVLFQILFSYRLL